MDKEKIRKTLLEVGFKTDSNRDKYFFMEVDLQDRPDPFLWQLIKMHGTCNQRRVLKQLHDDIETELQGPKHQVLRDAQAYAL